MKSLTRHFKYIFHANINHIFFFLKKCMYLGLVLLEHCKQYSKIERKSQNNRFVITDCFSMFEIL